MSEAQKRVIDSLNYGDEFLWDKKRDKLLFQLMNVRRYVRSWKRTFIGEIGIEHIKEIEKSIQLLIDKLKCYDSFSKVVEMQIKKEGGDNK